MDPPGPIDLYADLVHVLPMTKHTDYHQFKMRLPRRMMSLLAEAATDNKRTLSAEIIERLDRSLSAAPGPSDWEARLIQLQMRVEAQLTAMADIQKHMEAIEAFTKDREAD